MCTYINIYVYVFIYIHIYIHLCMYVCICIYMYIHTCVCLCVCVHEILFYLHVHIWNIYIRLQRRDGNFLLNRSTSFLGFELLQRNLESAYGPAALSQVLSINESYLRYAANTALSIVQRLTKDWGERRVAQLSRLFLGVCVSSWQLFWLLLIWMFLFSYCLVSVTWCTPTQSRPRVDGCAREGALDSERQ